VSRLLTAKRRAERGLDTGRASATLLISGKCQLGPGLHADAKPLTDLVRLGGLLLDDMHRRDLLNRWSMGNITAKFLAECRCVVRENLRVMCAARNGNVGHAAIEKVLCAKVGVHVDQNAVGGLALAGMAGEGVAVVEMQVSFWIEIDGAATVHLQVQLPVFSYALDFGQFAVCHLEVIGGRGELDPVALRELTQFFAEY